ncbi:cupin domain-containing protein [Sinomonas terrae]|uniref:Cupin domain-containing protein n=1 Tax=Sinomonas terrae TaxID=2908838 RepID=A0ABS9U4G8_9MICC|nr:cupin domain-containing protein [Sinomonas terrae]MCH6471578.1 cupin domain-containing protein [Sinomonas terrae]
MSAPTFHATTDPERAEPFAVGQVQWLRKPGDGDRLALSGGIWTVTPEEAPDPFDLAFEEDETLYIVEGQLRIEIIGAETFDLTDGSMASFNKGAKTRWTVVKPTTEFFVYS